jgi:type II secretory pathway pseudopilin PulG
VLGTTLWLIVVMGLLATVALDAAAGYGRAALHGAADHAVEAAVHDAVADYQRALQTAIARTPPNAGSYAAALATIPDPLQGTPAPATGAGPGAPRFALSYSVTPTTLTAPVCRSGAAAASSGPDTIGWLQCAGPVQESRMSLHVSVRVLDAAGSATVAQREDDVTLRLFAEPPYSALVGRKDPAAAGDPVHEGDGGGDTVSGAVLASGSPARPGGGTVIHVRYECHDGTGHCANAAPPAPDDALQPWVQWTNGNRPTP